MLIDTHCHLEWDSYQDQLEAVLKRAKEAGVGKIVTIGTDEASSAKTRVLVTKYDQVFRTVGYHPDCVLQAGFDEAEIGRLMKALESEIAYPKTVGIGECGLDYYAIERAEGVSSTRKEELKDLQRELFERQILVAIAHELPLSLGSLICKKLESPGKKY
jgi:TatD DNase family protein